MAAAPGVCCYLFVLVCEIEFLAVIVRIRHTFQLGKGLLGQRPHIPVHTRHGCGDLAYRPASVCVVVHTEWCRLSSRRRSCCFPLCGMRRVSRPASLCLCPCISPPFPFSAVIIFLNSDFAHETAVSLIRLTAAPIYGRAFAGAALLTYKFYHTAFVITIAPRAGIQNFYIALRACGQ